MPTHLERLAARVVGVPLLIMPSKLGVIANVLAGRIGVDVEAPELGVDLADRPEPLASRFVGKGYDAGGRLPYQRTEAGAAIITVTGSMVNRGAWIGASSGLTSYEGIAAQLRAAAADPQVSSILLDLHTGGGEATGAFELAELVAQVNGTKLVTAFVNGLAASAGYMLASGAGRIVSVPSGITGSIGVVMMHADYSRALDKAGITPTLIHAGSHKVDANPYQPLAPETKAKLQAEVDGMREDFVQLVAKGRGRRLSAKAARDTEAAVFTGKEALAIGLVDELASFDTLFDSMNRGATRTRSAGSKPQGSRRMEHDDIERARMDGAAGERARIKAILTSPEAKGREASAQHLAFESEMTAEAVGGLLKTMTKHSSLDQRMRETERGFHTAGTFDTGVRKPPVVDAAAIYAARNKAERDTFEAAR